MPRIVILSGAGISADSGLPTFRAGEGNLWAGHDVNVVCHDWTWKRHYATVHAFYNDRRAEYAAATPNRAHEVVAGWQRDREAVVITQNIDDLFERAGCVDVVHVHGRVDEMLCTACRTVTNVGSRSWDVTVDACPASPNGRPCGCRKGMKPNVVFFRGEAPLYKSMRETLDSLTGKDVVVVCGTSSQVIDFEALLFDRPGTKVYANLEPPRSDIYDHVFLGRASETFDAVDAIVRDMVPAVAARPAAPVPA